MKSLRRTFLAVVAIGLVSLSAQSASAQGCCKAGLCKIPQLPTGGANSQVNSMLQQFDDARTPARQASAATVQPAAASITEISLVNPVSSNQKVEYVLDGKAYALEPGMSLTMKAAAARRIEFSRDANGAKATYRVSRGVYEFAQSASGWELYRTQR